MDKVDIYRFHERVAINVYGATIYFYPKDAQAIARAINACAKDIKTQPNFSQSEFPPVRLTLRGEE